eukprot:tig00020912_g15773.t1
MADSNEIDLLLRNFEQIQRYGAILHDEGDPDFDTPAPYPAAAAAIANSYLGAGERPRKRNRRTQGPKRSRCPLRKLQLYRPRCELHSNYLRKYHVSERLKQHCLEDSPVPRTCWQLSARRMAGKEWSKDNIRQVLRALKQQKYIERWAQIKWRITGERPPPMSAEDMDRVQEMFALVEVPFSMFKSQGRKNMLNYNYVFRQIFVLLDLPQHLPFFPLLKSRQKLSELDSIWNRICEYNDWHFFPTL